MEAQIGGAQENLLACDDPRTFKSLSARITTMRDELDRLKAELTVPEIVHTGMTEAEYDALDRWYADLYRRSVTVLVPKNRKAPWPAHAMPDSDRLHMPADARLINEALITLGVKVKLWWKATGGTPYKRHQVAKGSFEIGEKSGQIEGDNFTAPVCRRAGRRCRCRPL